jgi:hypothetical protein
MRRTILSFAAAGAMAFFVLFALAFMQPVTLEKWARAAITHEVQDRVTERLHPLDEAALVKTGERIVARNNENIAETKAALTQQLPSKIALVIEQMLHPDCPCRLRSSELGREIQLGRIESLEKANARVTHLIESKYRDVAQALLMEVKIFSAANGTVLLLLALTAWRWTRPALQLLAPAIVMVVAAAATSAIYLFKQDWLHTIVFGDYVGLYYIPYLLVALSFLADVVFARARLTIVLLGVILAALGGIFGLAAC